MKLWILKPQPNLSDEDNPWEPWFDKCHGMIIQAETEDSARSIANSNGKNETRNEIYLFENKNYTSIHPWRHEKYSTCQELIPGENEGVILIDVRMS